MREHFRLRNLFMIFWTLTLMQIGAARGQAQGNIQITNDPSSMAFFYIMAISNEAATVTKVEIRDNNNFTSWSEMSPLGGSWAFDAGSFGFPLTAPASLRLTSTDDEVLTSIDLITMIGPASFDFGTNFNPPVDCADGTVNSGVGAITDVLFVNASAGLPERTVTVGVGEAITVSMDAAPAGSSSGLYILWLWVGPPMNDTDFMAQSSLLGCTVNPTPLDPMLNPQPFRCLKSPAIPSAACSSVTILTSPPSAPWSATKASGFGGPATFTLQGLLRDEGAGNPTGFSVTNAVQLVVE